mgnify:CR=1 FL=1
MNRRKLSASAINCFLKSPKQFYWRYKANLEPINISVGSFSHDALAGSLWAAAVDRFYKGVGETENTKQLLTEWQEQTQGWVPDRLRNPLTDALAAWMGIYYQLFDPKDGVRNGSEKRVENDRFVGYLDGLDHTGKIVHECKSTSRSPQIAEQVWRTANSVQVKLYAVLTQADGIRLEYAWKDQPYAIYRCDIIPVTVGQRKAWESELTAIADAIEALGDNPENFVCHPDGCCIFSKRFASVCGYSALCSGLPGAEIGFKQRESNRA